ncbi:MAG: hypothetical protein ACRENZ_11400 [Thermodesulfobacteriota bacterium]
MIVRGLLCSILVLFILYLTSQAELTYVPIRGKLAIYGKYMVDLPPDESKDSHIYFHLEGDSARSLWNSMKVNPEYDECLDNGSKTKRIGNMQCTQQVDDKTFDCYFSIDVQKQSIENGINC